MDNTKQSLTTLSLCTGYGGIERGLELAGEQLDVCVAVEIEAFAIANLVAKMEEGKLAPSPIWSNLKTLPVEPFRDRVDLITGGYPCQPFSAAGKRAGTDDPRHLWPYIADIIRAVRPTQCFFENVEGHISLGLREVISDLESLGYRTTWGIFSATEAGAHHQRKRVYILADSGRPGLQGAKWLREAGAKGVSERHSAQCFGELGGWQGGRGATWSPEPNVGQLAYGNTSRLDGLRGLGEIEHDKRWVQLPCEKDAEGCLRELRKYTKALCSPHRPGLDEQQPFKYTDALQFLSHIGTPSSGGHPDSEAEAAMSALRQNIVSAGVVLDTSDAPEAVWESLTDAEKAWLAMATCHGCNWEDIPIGRVTAESPNRVDCIRLLGNGVVPQTAAKAWTTLNEELANEPDET